MCPDISFPRYEYRIKFKKLQKHVRKVDIFKILEKENFILVEGGMGAGKSKLIRRLIDHYGKPDVYIKTCLFPIPATYKEFIEQFDGDIEKLINARVSEKLKKEFHENIKFLLLIDGVDEKNLPVEEQLNTLRELAKSIIGNSSVKVVVTSRYLKSLDETNELEDEISRYHLQPLSLRRTVEFITTVCNKLNITDRLFEDLKKSALFRELPRSPIAAILLANLLNENSKDLPSNLTELYSKYVELVLGRWDIEKGLQSQKEYEALNTIMMSLAKYMLENEIVMLSLDEAKKFFTSYLQTRNLNIEADELFNIMIERSELMLIDWEKKTLAFKHRTFAEFFYAKACLRDKDMHIDQRAFQLYWMNTFFFYLGILKDAPEVLRELVSLKPTSEAEEWLKVINMSNFFMAAYASPYDIVSEGVTKTMIEAAALYKKVISGGSMSPFAKLPRMHILYIFQYLLRYGYSYDFFIHSLEDAALEIDQSNLDKETKAYALFFLNVAYIDTGAGKSFDFLLKEHSDDLPFDLALAYKHESESIKVRTALMKKQDKHLKKLLKHNRQLDKAMDELYENPIGALTKEAKKLSAQ